MALAFFGRAARPLLLAGLLPLAAACDNDDDPVAKVPDQVTFTQAGLYPEGQQYDATGTRFLVSSQTAGRIGQVSTSGAYTVFADNANLVSTIGLNLDVAGGRDRLLAAVSDPGYNAARTSATTKGKLAALAIFGRSTGALSSFVNLGALRPNAAAHFANDIAVDEQGNAYVTDSYAPLIYKVDAQGAATVLLENAALAAPAGKFGLNGIVYQGGYLLVAKSDEGKLLKVPLANPAGFSTVTLPAGLDLSGDDGLLLADSNTLLVACNAQGRVYRLTTTDGFATVSNSSFFATGAVYPTTLSKRGTDAYVLYSYLNALQAMQNPPVSDFTLARVQL